MILATSIFGKFSEKANVILLLALIAAVGMLAESRTESRHARSQLQTTMEMTNRTIATATSQQSSRDEELRKALAEIATMKNSVRTPAEALAALPAALPKLPEPIVIAPTDNPQSKTPGATGNQTAAALETAGALPPATIEIPQVDLKPLYDAAEDCRACQAKLTAAQSDLSDEKSRLTAVTQQRDAALNLAKGGGFWTRTKRAARWLLIGAACGALAAKVLH